MLTFQSTLSRRERLYGDDRTTVLSKISIHALTKRATLLFQLRICKTLRFQSTLSRRERLVLICLINKGLTISIHALTKRATRLSCWTKKLPYISIHALTKRATFYKRSIYFKPKHFNPRSHEESDVTKLVDDIC